MQGVEFDEQAHTLTIPIDFVAGSRFSHPQVEGQHPVHDTKTKRLRRLNFFQHECYLSVYVPRVRLPDGRLVLLELPWVGKLSGFTLLFEALVLTLARQMPFSGVARLVVPSLTSGLGREGTAGTSVRVQPRGAWVAPVSSLQGGRKSLHARPSRRPILPPCTGQPPPSTCTDALA
jgi:hypothetical protein